MSLRGSPVHAINIATSTTVAVTVSGIGGTGPLNGDVVILIVNNGGSTTPTFTFPSGFNSISGCPETLTSSGGSNIGCAYKIAGSSEPSSYTVTSTNTDFFSVQCWVFYGRNTAAPFTATATTSSTAISGTGDQSCTLTGVTAANGDDVLAFWGPSNNCPSGIQDINWTTVPSGFGNSDSAPNSGQGSGFICLVAGCVDQAVAGGATGSITGVLHFHTTGSGFPPAFAGYAISLAAAAPSFGNAVFVTA